MIVECGLQPQDDIMIGFTEKQEDYDWESGGGATCFKGNNLAMTFSYNILSENICGAAWYADIDAKGTRIIGNAFWNNVAGGIYNEYAVDDTIVIGNAFHKSPVTAAMCTRLSVVENYFFECGLCWFSREWWMLRDSYMFCRKNIFLNPTYGYLLNAGKPFTNEGFTSNVVDRDRIYAADGAALLSDSGADKTLKSIEDIRKDYGFEQHGDLRPYRGQAAEEVVRDMGGSIVTFRIPWGKHSHEARPMLSNADFECRWPAAPHSPPSARRPRSSGGWPTATTTTCCSTARSIRAASTSRDGRRRRWSAIATRATPSAAAGTWRRT